MTIKAIFAIVLFIIVYLALLSLAIGITALCVVGGFTIIIAKPMLLTIGLGIGLASLGFFILVFLFKFLFKKHKIDRNHLTEITEEQEPKLFQFIRQIVNEVDTDFPQKVYISSDVNASVFYNSSFWSMFFPIRKNLQIGLGLVNTISEQEFKAILAHEFGHFSQRSMKVGSYVYNVNQVIFNLIYENESFDGMIQKWANISGYFSFFVALAVKIIEGIQWILRKMYDFINISYMGLSREMEFHADEVAANVAGYLPLKESLLRMDLAQHSYNDVLNFYGNRIIDNLKSRNIYNEQTFVMNFIASENKIQLKDNLPLVTAFDLNKFNKSKLNIKDQWASHPTTDERIEALEKLNIIKDNPSTGPANALFANTNSIEEEATLRIFSTVVYEGEAELVKEEKFRDAYTESYFKNSFPKIYNGYYDNKNPVIASDVDLTTEDNCSPATLFSTEQVDKIYELIALVQDIATLENIAQGVYPIKTFDYDGKKFTKKEAKDLVVILEQELEVVKEHIKQNDGKIYRFFLQKAIAKGKDSEFKNKLDHYLSLDAEHDKKAALYSDIAQATSFVSVVTPNEEIEGNFKKLMPLEAKIKAEIRLMLDNKQIESEIHKVMRQNFENYLSVDFVYFGNGSYYDDNLQIFFGAINDYNYLLSRIYFLTKQDLLKFQAELI
ncbi:Zn-dependent protease with chaperone function [Flavobacterium arsenatis]|uniref:Zn-dependent protease with chaperone function n=1 Tax=Flavobacterium arsenatis TaxID=1484332 RepID=A0ABU1TSF5_9FLAO|nr:M48 family metallopeptidase [Flavobacterium arsenatis]MDR6968808.1 Zn-dependent protease with chaperone function [Flavobacterium arsenatis]